MNISRITGHRPWATATPPTTESNDIVTEKKTVHLGFLKSHKVSEEDKNNYFLKLDSWANSAPTESEFDGRKKAIDTIKDFVTRHGYTASKKHPLNLNDLGITSLPPLPDGIKKLDISYNQLRHIGNLPSALRSVNMEGNNLSAPPENIHTLSRKCIVALDESVAQAAFHQRAIYRIQESNPHLGPLLQFVHDGSLPPYESVPSNAFLPPPYAPPMTPPPSYTPPTMMRPHTPPPSYEFASSHNAQQHESVNDAGNRLPSIPRAIPSAYSPDMMAIASTRNPEGSNRNMLQQDSASTSTMPLTPQNAWTTHRRVSDSSLSNLSTGSDDVFLPRWGAETSV